jgi:hypothetical protein
VSRGFVEAVGGQLDLEDTPSGGCTMVVRLPAVVDHTSSIIDADLDEDIVVPDDSGEPQDDRDTQVRP